MRGGGNGGVRVFECGWVYVYVCVWLLHACKTLVSARAICKTALAGLYPRVTCMTICKKDIVLGIISTHRIDRFSI